MKLGQLGLQALGKRLRGPGLAWRNGPFSIRLRTDLVAVRDGLHILYADHPLVPDGDFCDGDITLRQPRATWGWRRPLVQAHVDYQPIFEPVPVAHALPLVEWLLNWHVTAHGHHFLTVHAAALERGGKALLLPAPSGSGKSTLCAALVHRGWRLLSDEFALIDFATGLVHPLVRPVSLKNQSIEVLRAFAPEAVFSAPAHGTPKGTLAQMKAPAAHVQRMDEPARPVWIVFPQWSPGATLLLQARPKARALLELTRQTVNLDLAGHDGFARLADLVTASDCLDLRYDMLADAVAAIDAMAQTIDHAG